MEFFVIFNSLSINFDEMTDERRDREYEFPKSPPVSIQIMRWF